MDIALGAQSSCASISVHRPVKKIGRKYIGLLFRSGSSSNNRLENVKNMASKETGSKFLYFAFGSNMCTKRIHINNPSAVFKHVAVVEGYKLFFGYSDTNVSLKLTPGD